MRLSFATPSPGLGPRSFRFAAAVTPALSWGIMTTEHSERLTCDHRLRATRDFAAVKAGGTAFRGAHCMLLVLAQPGQPTRLGFVASRKGVGGAVQRNRARRRLREIVRRRFPRMPESGYWMVLIAFHSCLAATHQDLASDVERLLAGAGALAPLESESH